MVTFLLFLISIMYCPAYAMDKLQITDAETREKVALKIAQATIFEQQKNWYTPEKKETICQNALSHCMQVFSDKKRHENPLQDALSILEETWYAPHLLRKLIIKNSTLKKYALNKIKKVVFSQKTYDKQIVAWQQMKEELLPNKDSDNPYVHAIESAFVKVYTTEQREKSKRNYWKSYVKIPHSLSDPSRSVTLDKNKKLCMELNDEIASDDIIKAHNTFNTYNATICGGKDLKDFTIAEQKQLQNAWNIQNVINFPDFIEKKTVAKTKIYYAIKTKDNNKGTSVSFNIAYTAPHELDWFNYAYLSPSKKYCIIKQKNLIHLISINDTDITEMHPINNIYNFWPCEHKYDFRMVQWLDNETFVIKAPRINKETALNFGHYEQEKVYLGNVENIKKGTPLEPTDHQLFEKAICDSRKKSLLIEHVIWLYNLERSIEKSQKTLTSFLKKFENNSDQIIGNFQRRNEYKHDIIGIIKDDVFIKKRTICALHMTPLILSNFFGFMTIPWSLPGYCALFVAFGIFNFDPPFFLNIFQGIYHSLKNPIAQIH
ncbi:MAG TPA: hypothetical protein VEK38_02910 [Candidatus Bathyarchaeia archaeon]|nr:hypothetical protein [Candidatus Bathyarchaeia archaeon]